MKTLFFTALFLVFCFLSSAQTQPKVGDELKINEPYAQSFHHVFFPKPNILIKRGKVATYNSVYGTLVVIDDIITKDDGTTYVILKKKDGSKFWRILIKIVQIEVINTKNCCDP